ncbi:MAG: FTR1 family protein, partial [Candidatus Geothermarchaeales archaeon]
MIPLTLQLGPVTVASFLITFREALEAALIIAILVVYLRKIHKAELNKYVWLGSTGAVAGSLLLGALVLTIYGGLEGPVVNLFEGVASVTATVVLSYMILWMARNSKRIKGELEHGIDISISTGELLGIAVLAFVAVFREGLETVLFLTASFFLEPGETMIGLALGASVVVALAVLLMRGTVRLPIKTFFKFTSV